MHFMCSHVEYSVIGGSGSDAFHVFNMPSGFGYAQVSTNSDVCGRDKVVPSKEACEIAAASLGLQDLVASITDPSARQSVPAGCYYEQGGANQGLWFNPSLSSTSDGSAFNDFAVCLTGDGRVRHVQ